MENLDLKKECLDQKDVNIMIDLSSFVETLGQYRYAGNSYEIFDKFFGSTNPFTDKPEDDGRDQFGSMFGDAFGGQHQPLPPVPEDIVIELECSLYEFYNGSLKKINFSRELMSHDGRTTKSH